MKTGDIVRLRPNSHNISLGLITVPEGHPPWSPEWDVLTTFAWSDVGLVTQVMRRADGHLCVKLFTSRGSGWIEGCELTNL
jgi:hypothetical protein